MERLRGIDFLGLALVLAVAAGARAGYLATCADNGKGTPALEVQGQPPAREASPDAGRNGTGELAGLVQNLKEHNWFGSLAPLADREESTAHIAPGYYWLYATLARFDLPAEMVLRWLQCFLGVLTAVCYFFFTRRVFQSLPVGLVAGLLCAVHPFWVINTAELGDGVLATFLLAACLTLGTRASQAGGAFTSLVFGLALAGMAMVRAALLPFALVALLWFLLRCRSLKGGWFCGLLAFLGFANGLAPWAVRNWQEFGDVVPVVDSAMLHLWMGNNPRATGGYLDEATLRQSLPSERLQELLAEANQARRYAMLGKDLVQEISRDPGAVAEGRLWSGLTFIFGESWFHVRNSTLLQKSTSTEVVAPPAWLDDMGEGILRFSLLAMLLLTLLGWRFTHAWRKEIRLATLAAVLVPLPYILSHAGPLSGPRLPVDGVWLCFAAYALACWLPGVRREPEPS